MRTAQFDVRPFEDGTRQWIPLVDGVSLVALITEFESHMEDTALGGYAGPVLEHFDFHDLESYLLGAVGAYPGDGVSALLGCGCGELDCWPLYARITVAHGQVTWDQFSQPYRPKRDYSGFGPFVFDESQYREAITSLAAQAS